MSGTFKRENFYEWCQQRATWKSLRQILTLSNESQQIWEYTSQIRDVYQQKLSVNQNNIMKVLYNCYHYFYAFNVNHRLVRHELWIYERTSLEIWLSFAIWHKCIGCRNIMYNFQKEKMVVILVFAFFCNFFILGYGCQNAPHLYCINCDLLCTLTILPNHIYFINISW